jgi:ubiquinone/menaquinone biosynthesis C-methylase UbiE
VGSAVFKTVEGATSSLAGSIPVRLREAKLEKNTGHTLAQPLGGRRDVDRSAWLAERRSAVRASYTDEAPTYDDGYDPATAVHRRFVARLIASCPAGGSVLDAACGTGPYIGMVLAAGLRVVGTDQSPGMLARARAKHPTARFELTGLQELAFDGGFDAAMCVDAMENVPPEEWPVVLQNLRCALRPSGSLYLTVEEVDRDDFDQVLREATARGVPAVLGEVVSGDTAGYHYYPERDRVAAWLKDAGLDMVEEADEPLDGYRYHHVLALRATGSGSP